MSSALSQWIGLGIFCIAVLHTFFVSRFRHWAKKFPDGSVLENILNLLGEVEIVFGLWSMVLLFFVALIVGTPQTIAFLESQNFSEPIFVFVILTVCSSRPLLDWAEMLITFLAGILPLNRSISFYLVTLTVGPILGSFITEPAAMTVTAFLLLDHFFSKNIPQRLKYATLGLLFVNVSIGGTLTHFAAPPVLMVAGKWGWGLEKMFFDFGWKGILACFISTIFVIYFHRETLRKLSIERPTKHKKIPTWVRFIHLIFLLSIVASAHHSVLVVGLLLLFLGFVEVTKEYQEAIRIKEGLLVAYFLAGLIVLGSFQAWWLKPVLEGISPTGLYLTSIALTSVVDNAALTYLGSLVPDLPELARYFLVAGAVVGGGLTVIANAPNPVAFNILSKEFGPDGISPLGLLAAALPPTVVAGLCFWFL